jgi:CHASE3 domain sensor protein
MGILDKTRELASKAADSASEVVDHVTGRSLVQEAEKFNEEMEAVCAALVTRVLATEERIDRLEQRLKWAIGFAVIAIVVSLTIAILRFW